MRILCSIALLFFAGLIESRAQAISAPLHDVTPAGTVSEKPLDERGLPAGHPAFSSLTVSKLNGSDAWVVSGVIVSTNAGGPVQGAAILVGYDDEAPQMVAMSNLRGETLFAVHPYGQRTVLPNRVYVGSRVIGSGLSGGILRRYVLQLSE